MNSFFILSYAQTQNRGTTELEKSKLKIKLRETKTEKNVKFICEIFKKYTCKGCPKTGIRFSPDGFVTPPIGIPTKRMYSVVHYLSNKHPRTSVHQLDLELPQILWKQLRVHLQKNKEKMHKEKFIHSHYPHFPRRTFDIFLSQNTVRLQLNMLPFFRPIF